MPYFCCEVMFAPILKLNIDFEYYKIDENLEPVFDFSRVQKDEAFLYVNYFGIKDNYVHSLSEKVINLIVDNAQSFFSEPLERSHTLYSVRKFIGVADGAYLFTNRVLNIEFDQDKSFDRMGHLLKRIDSSAEDAYQIFLDNENSLSNQPIMVMSNLTKKILSSIDYDSVKRQRQKNFQYLHESLKDTNLLKVNKPENQIPMVYPYRIKNLLMRKKLQDRKVYCATYWPSVLDNVGCRDGIEHELVNEIIPIPIDQRYNLDDMKTILEIIHQ